MNALTGLLPKDYQAFRWTKYCNHCTVVFRTQFWQICVHVPVISDTNFKTSYTSHTKVLCRKRVITNEYVLRWSNSFYFVTPISWQTVTPLGVFIKENMVQIISHTLLDLNTSFSQLDVLPLSYQNEIVYKHYQVYWLWTAWFQFQTEQVSLFPVSNYIWPSVQ